MLNRGHLRDGKVHSEEEQTFTQQTEKDKQRFTGN
jgi:hypothetical protein